MIIQTKSRMEDEPGYGPTHHNGQYHVFNADDEYVGLCNYIGKVSGVSHARDILYFSFYIEKTNPDKRRKVFGIPYENLREAVPARWCRFCKGQRSVKVCETCGNFTTLQKEPPDD